VETDRGGGKFWKFFSGRLLSWRWTSCVYESPLLVIPTVDVLALEQHDNVAGAGCASRTRIFEQSHCVRQSAVPM
jgi:hypothetical protein